MPIQLAKEIQGNAAESFLRITEHFLNNEQYRADEFEYIPQCLKST